MAKVIPLDAIELRLSKLHDRDEEIGREISALQEEQAEIAREAVFLESLAGDAVDLPEGASSTPSKYTARKGSIADRIRTLVSEEPGLSRQEVIRRIVADGADSEAKDPAQSVGNSVTNLASRGQIKRSPDGRLYPADGTNGQQSLEDQASV